jgi:hypothetical protein
MMRRLGLVGLAGAALGLTAEWVGFGWGDPRHWVPDLAVGWTLIGCGLVAWARRPQSRTGALLAATGFAWFVGNFAQVGVAAVAWLAAHLVYLYRGPLMQLVLTYPSGRPGSRLVRGAIAAGYAAAVVTPIWDSEAATILLAGLLLGVCVREYVQAVGGARRTRLIALQAAAGLSLVLAGTAAARLLLPQGRSAVRCCWSTRRRSAASRPVSWPVLSWPHANGRPSPTWSSSSARPARARSADSCRGRWATRRLRSAIGCPSGRGSSTSTAACSLSPMPVRAAR